jgi:hypothetical protein
MQKRSFDKTLLSLPTDVADHLGFGPVKVSAHSKVEKSLLDHFKEKNGRLPILNLQRK